MNADKRKEIRENAQIIKSYGDEVAHPAMVTLAEDVLRLSDALDAADAREAVYREALQVFVDYHDRPERTGFIGPGDNARYMEVLRKARAALSTDGSEVLERLKKAERERDSWRSSWREESAIVDRTWKALGVIASEAPIGKTIDQLDEVVAALRIERDRMLAALRSADKFFEQIDSWLYEENPEGGSIPGGIIKKEWRPLVRSIPGVLPEEG